jgi:hypothetical protein
MMSSSDGRGVAGQAAVAVEPGISAAAISETTRKPGAGSAAASAELGKPAPASSEPDRPAAGSPDAGRCEPGDREQDDPWFGAARPAAETASAAAGYRNGSDDDSAMQRANEAGQSAVFDPEATMVDWFLPGGRAALLPDSVTESAGEGESGPRQRPAPGAAGVPPWAAETTASAPGAPPPWENGPWPGPGAPRPSRPAADPPGRPRQPAARQDEPLGPWTPRTMLITGLLPLVVPGLVVGLIGLRRTSSGEPGRRASVLALAASLAWAVVIVVLVASATGGSPGGCSYPAGVHQAYATAMADLSRGAPAATQATDLGLAASRANSAAAAAAEPQAHTALFAMAGDLQQAREDVIANRPVPPSLRTQLTADGAALTASCRA